MAKASKPLTVKRIAALKARGRYHDGHGLYLQITPTGVKSWLLRYERSGRERWLGLGPIHTVGLKEARERARAARLQLLDGVNPIDARKAQKAAAALEAAKVMTFETAAVTYYKQHEPKWKSAKHSAQFIGSLRTYAFPQIGRLAVADVDTGQVLRVLEPIWHKVPETASRVRNRIESVLGWAKVRGYRTGDNPAQWRGHLAEVLPARGQIQKPTHHAALPYAELPAFMAQLAIREGIPARALEFLILTAARTGEVVGTTWAEIDLEARIWTVPTDRMKGGREHRVPLSARALAVLRALPREHNNPFVFIGVQKPAMNHIAMAQLLTRMRAGITVHGFRSTFRDWAAERTACANHIVEMALAHAIGSKVEQAYRRGDLFHQRQQLMDAWARFATSEPTTSKVIGIREARASS